MFDQNSRYAKQPTATLTMTDADGHTREVRYVLRRFVPPVESGVTLVEHIVIQGERLDNITAQYLGDPTRFWQICDANLIETPEELTETPGRTIRVALSGV